MNWLFCGDCLTVMRERMADESVDLIYLDPPFNSGRDYKAIFRAETGRPGSAEATVFKDTWTLDDSAIYSINVLPGLLAQHEIEQDRADLLWFFLRALKQSQPDMAAYLAFMALRLVEVRRVLKSSGSVYLHCDPSASHYLKIVMDALFGRDNFINEIVWHYRKWTNAASRFQRNHDLLLVYAKAVGTHTFNKLFNEGESYHYRKGWHTNTVDGGILQLIVYDRDKAKVKIDGGGYDRVVYREGAKRAALPDVWSLPIINSQANERLGYPTQKPVALLDRIVKASSNPGDLVLDPFCGCATTIEAAEVNGRKWIGIDSAKDAILGFARRRLRKRFGLVDGEHYRLETIPPTA